MHPSLPPESRGARTRAAVHLAVAAPRGARERRPQRRPGAGDICAGLAVGATCRGRGAEERSPRWGLVSGACEPRSEGRSAVHAARVGTSGGAAPRHGESAKLRVGRGVTQAVLRDTWSQSRQQDGLGRQRGRQDGLGRQLEGGGGSGQRRARSGEGT